MLMTLGFLSPVIELYLKTFGLSNTQAGLIYSIYTTFYFASSLLETYISHLCNQQMLIALGILLTGISFLLISQILISGHLIIVIIGLAIMGSSAAIMYSNS